MKCIFSGLLQFPQICFSFDLNKNALPLQVFLKQKKVQGYYQMNQKVKNYGLAIRFTVIVSIVIFTVTLFFSRDQSLSKLQKNNSIRIGYSTEAPFTYIKKNGEVTGESPEVAKRVVAQLGIKNIEWQYCKYGSLISGLESGKFDVIAAGMFITRERAQRILFSEPSIHVLQAMLVRKGNPLEIHSYEQTLEQTDIKIAVLDGSVEADMLRKMGLREAQIVFVPDARTGRVAVETRVADGLALSSPTIRSMQSQNRLGSTEIANPFYQPKNTFTRHSGYTAYGFKKNDRQLQKAWNDVMKKFIGSPEHTYLISLFGFTKTELPGTVTTRQVLSNDTR
jgi:polar amino acid transport system substrate-binding protein